MGRNGWYAFLLSLAFGVSSCTDNSPRPGELQIGAKSRQISKCIKVVLSGRSIADSSFGCRFGDTLCVHFLLSGNCCPDSNRFTFLHHVSNDTLYVDAIDTERHLCNCICNYLIRAEFVNLPLDRYTFICGRPDYGWRVYYGEIVVRD